MAINFKPEHIGISEILERACIKDSYLFFKQNPDFPKPLNVISVGKVRVYDRHQVLTWLANYHAQKKGFNLQLAQQFIHSMTKRSTQTGRTYVR